MIRKGTQKGIYLSYHYKRQFQVALNIFLNEFYNKQHSLLKLSVCVCVLRRDTAGKIPLYFRFFFLNQITKHDNTHFSWGCV